MSESDPAAPARTAGPRDAGPRDAGPHNAGPRAVAGTETVGDRIDAPNARWSFGGSVPDSFEAHIERSVPGYREGHDLVAHLSDFFLARGSVAYELGCSTGALTRRLAAWNAGKGVRFVGIEIEPAMAEHARAAAAGLEGVEIRQGDAMQEEFEPADLIVSYYTMQFVRPALRQGLFDRIYASLNWGGAFVMFEKVRGPDARFQDILTTLYNDFKLDNGFDAQEIVAKTRSLKGVLEPFSTQANIDLMRRAGFVDIATVYKRLCFEGFLAIK